MSKFFQRQKLSLLIAGVGLFCACGGGTATVTKERGDREIASVEGFMSEPLRTVFRRSCESCHGIDGQGIAGIAPDLRRSKSRSPEEWEAYLRHPGDSHPVAQMPPVWLDQDEIKIVAAYLADLSRENKP